MQRLLLPEYRHQSPFCVALLGGGGKTTLQYKLGRTLAERYPRVLLTSITKSAWHDDPPIIYRDQIKNGDLTAWFEQMNPLNVMGKCVNKHKVEGISEDELRHYHQQARIAIVESDGARNQPLKVHRDTDPTVPDFCNQVIVIVGADVVNTTLADGKVHRPELFRETWGIDDEFVLTPDFIARVVTQGYAVKIPDTIPRTYFINKADTDQNQAEMLAKAIFSSSRCPTWVGSVHAGTIEPLT